MRLSFSGTIQFVVGYIRVGLILLIPATATAQQEDWDSDQDAMPNGYEFYGKLDENDPRDAWQDPDGDGICNLYEYFLATDPQDKNQPVFINYNGQQSLSEAIRNAGRGVVLRVPQGNYALNYRHESLADPPRLLIQGGWNNDFSERDHCRYPTTLEGGEQGAIFDFLIASGNASALLIDGCTLSGGSRGAIQHTSYLSKAQLLIGNCALIENTAHRASSIVHFEDGDATLISDFILINTTVAANHGTAVRSVQHANRTNFKVLHSLLAFNAYADNDGPPYSSGYGLDIRAETDSTFNLQFANSIFWGNANLEVRVKNPTIPVIAANSQNNIFGFVQAEIEETLFDHPSNRSVDPLLQAGELHTFYPSDHSPILQAGINIGFSLSSNPDIGPLFCDTRIPTANKDLSIRDTDWHLFPNPAKQTIWLTGALTQTAVIQTSLYDVQGRQLRLTDHGRQIAGVIRLPVPTDDLVPGIYYLEIGIMGQKVMKRLIKSK